MRLVHAFIVAACVLAPTATAHAAIIATASLDVVVSQSDHIVRGRVDLDRRTVEVSHVYRGEIASLVLHVSNLRQFGPLDDPLGRGERTVHPAEAILFLQELDGRYYLVHVGAPFWIDPHASICPIDDKDGSVLRYRQTINPGPVCLVREYENLGEFEAALAPLLASPCRQRPSTSLTPAELDRFYLMIAPYIDFYRREPAPPSDLAGWGATPYVDGADPDDLARFTRGLVAYVEESDGEARRRGIEALLILAYQTGPDRRRQGYVGGELLALLDRLGPEAFVDPLLAELRSDSYTASRDAAGPLLERIGGPAAAEAEAILRDQVIRHRGANVGCSSYWVLRRMGRSAAAEAALAEAERLRDR